MAGSDEELKCAKYLQNECSKMGLNARMEPFKTRMYKEVGEKLVVDGKEYPCRAYFAGGKGNIKAELYYLEGTDKVSLKKCRDKIVLTDRALGYKLYDMLKENGAKGFITYNGNLHNDNKDIERKTIGFETDDEKLPGVNIHISDALQIVKGDFCNAEILVDYSEHIGTSQNVILDLAGEIKETVIISAHYDSTMFSMGAYDNMSGCIGLLYLAKYFSEKPHKRSIRFLWCGSEERGLIGSRRYCKEHKEELKDAVLNINLDMLGCVMGGFTAFSCADEKMTELLERFIEEEEFCATVKYGIRSSDSNSFIYSGVPAVSFARYSPADIAPIHTRYDTLDVVSRKNLLKDMEFIKRFTKYVVNSKDMESISISQKIKDEVEEYMLRKKDIL